MKNSGLKNEIEFCNVLNGIEFGKLDNNFKNLLLRLYGKLNVFDIVYCRVDRNRYKYDIVISVLDDKKRLSLKSGNMNSVHTENLSYFIDFLKKNDIDKGIINDYLLYHFGDGTLNGTGNIRYPICSYKKILRKEIFRINKAFNENDIIEKAVERFIIKGRLNKLSIDGIIYGNIYNFIFIPCFEIKSIIVNSKNSYKFTPHFGSLVVQPFGRNLSYSKDKKVDIKRYQVQIKWYDILNDYLNK